MDRRSFLLGLAASTAALPVAKLMPSPIDWTTMPLPAHGELLMLHHENLTATEVMARYAALRDLGAYGHAMVATDWDRATREVRHVRVAPSEWLR